MRDFLDIATTDPAALRRILDAAHQMKKARHGLPRGAVDDQPALPGRALAMIFEKNSTRTRVSFEMAMRQLGGSAVVLSSDAMQLGRGESIADTARVLSRYVDAIMIRTASHDGLLELAEHATVPVINGLTDRSHPCQAMADALTLEERLGDLRGRRVAWFGDGNNMARTLAELAPALGYRFVFCGPEAHDLPVDAMAGVALERDPARAVIGADAIVTDTWMSMHDPEDARAAKLAALAPYQVNEALMARAPAHAVLLHCLPAHRGEEATDGVLDGPHSAIFDEAENRLHAQKAVLRWCLGAL